MPSIPRLPRAFGLSRTTDDAAPTARSSTASADAPADRVEEIPRFRVSDSSTADRGRGVWNFIRHNPAARAAVIGAGGLASLMGTMVSTVSAAPIEAPPSDVEAAAIKNIVFVGMNETSDHEVEKLRDRVGYNGVEYIEPGAVQDVIRHNGVRYDLNDKDETAAFIASLGITGERAENLEDRLSRQGQDGKDELAQLVVILNQAENGDRSIERIVFSGHSVGSGVWGDENGSLKWSLLRGVLESFPKAARQVEDVLLAACYSGGHKSMDVYRGMFPNLKTIWAYDGSAPGAWSGAVPHILRWEAGTRTADADKLDRDVAKHTRKGENVATWSATRGYDNGQPAKPLDKDIDKYETSSAYVPNFVDGTESVSNTQYGRLRDHYNNIQRLLSRNDISSDLRGKLETERDFTIRLIYFKNVKTYFQDVHSSSINSGFADLGLQAPDFSTMSRLEVLSTIANYNTKLAETENPSEMAVYLGELMTEGLKNLNPDFVPEAWI